MSITDQIEEKRLEIQYKNIDNCLWHIQQKAKTKNDMRAVNGIIDYVTKTRKNIIAKNPLFAKMVVYVYGNVLKAHNATPFDRITNHKMAEILSLDFDIAVANFVDELNLDELARRFEPITPESTKNKHPAFHTDEENKQLFDNYENLSHEEKATFWKKHYNTETVIDILNGVIANIIEKYND